MTVAEEQQAAAIYVRPRVMEVGNQVLPLRNISRVRSLLYDEKGRFTAGHWILLIVCAIALIGGFAASDNSTYNSDVSAGGSSIAAIAAIGFLIVIIHGAVATKNYYLLVIETSGAQSVALVSKDQNAIEWLKHQVVGALENPPTSQQVINLGHRIHLNGAQGVQIGNGNSQSNDFK